jgi:multidrug efflux pump subunit AcrB
MWIVRYALDRPYTSAVAAILLLIFGTLSAQRMSTDVFPDIDIPTINVVWIYGGLNAPEMASKITSFGEIAILNNVDDIRATETQTLNGVGMIRVSFQPGVDIEMAMAQVTSVSQTIIRRMPVGTQPPLIVRYSAASVPILQLALSSDTMTEAQLYDYGRIIIRSQIQTIPGLRLPLPYGGAPRQIMIDIDPDRLRTYGLSPADVADAVNAQNLTLPSGTLRSGETEFQVSLNSSPETLAAFDTLPVREIGGRTVFLRDVADVRDGGAVQTNIVRSNGQAGVLLTIMKLGGASTVDVVDQVLERLPDIRAAAPPGMRIEPLFDQSLFVGAAIDTILKEAVLVSLLIGFLVLVFLGSVNSTLIVLTSIPLALFASVIGLHALGHTLNVMTLGGLALAIGILVDNATVEIENIHRNAALGKPMREAILDGAQQVAFPEFIATICICIVFVPVFVLDDAARFLFTPLALAVVFAMIASYLLSRTLVPAMAHLLLKNELRRSAAGAGQGHGAGTRPSEAEGPFSRAHRRFERGFGQVREGYSRLLARTERRPVMVLGGALIVLAAVAALLPRVGQNLFPVVDAGQFRLHVKAPTGTRLEETAQLFAEIQREIRSVVPADELALVIDNIGLPEPINLAWSDSVTVGPGDGEILVALARGHRTPTESYVRALRERLSDRFPDAQFFFKPADMTSQILNAGLPAPIDVRFVGRDREGNLRLARDLEARLNQVPGMVDVTLRQIVDAPQYFITVDRMRAQELGLSQRDVADAVLVSLSSTATVAPSYWVDGRIGASYAVVVQAPPSRIASVEELLNTPIRSPRLERPVLLRNVATAELRQLPQNVSGTTFTPMLNVFASVDGADLGTAYGQVSAIVAELEGQLKPGNRIEVAGQVQAMHDAYADMARGLLLAVVLVYLVMVVNFQSWRDPAIVMSALPMAVAGAVLALFATGTTFSVPALMGIIMVLGVATANSILVVSFANERLAAGLDPGAAVAEAGRTRLRPVLMTALAMLLGMVPMALGLGEGGEQNAPLGRAVMGGLVFATAATLVVVPVIYRLAKRAPAAVTDPVSTEAVSSRSLPPGRDLQVDGVPAE